MGGNGVKFLLINVAPVAAMATATYVYESRPHMGGGVLLARRLTDMLSRVACLCYAACA